MTAVLTDVATGHPTAVRTQAVSHTSIPFGAAGLALWGLAVGHADYSRIGPFGLVTILGWTFFAALALIATGFAIELLRESLRPAVLLSFIVALIVVIFGTPSIVEPTARLTDAWLHAGFVQYIYVHGQVLQNFDARFSWPGALSLGAILVSFTGQHDAVAFLRWAPLVFELLYLAPLLVIARYSGASARARWLGVALFYVTNWIDQDYFSPQALDYLLFLVVVATVLACWGPGGAGPTHAGGGRRRIARVLDAMSRHRLGGHDAESNLDRLHLASIVVIMTFVILAASMSHQLTPFALVLALGACLLSRRLGRPEVLVLAVLLAVGWVSLGASNYWIGHLSEIFGSLGHAGMIVGSNVSNRLTGSQSHLWVVRLRILETLALFGLAVFGSLRRACDSRALEVLAAVPFLLVVVQNYGGEVLLRAVLFSLPFAALLVASAVFPERMGALRPLMSGALLRTRRPLPVLFAVAVVVFGLATLTTVVRGGNDAYESFSSGELAAVNFAYTHTVAGDTIGAIAPYLPAGQQGAGSVAVYVASDQGQADPTVLSLARDLERARPNFVVIGKAQEAWGEDVEDFPSGWTKIVTDELEQHGYRVAARWSTASVLQPKP